MPAADCRMLPWWGLPLRFAAALSVSAYVGLAYRVRGWGELPSFDESAVILSNHQIDLDPMAILSRFALHGGLRAPLFAASAKMLHEPGFLACRVPWLASLLHRTNFSGLFHGIGFLPIENQIRTRSLARWAFAVLRQRGNLPLTQVFSPAVVGRHGLAELWIDDLFQFRYFALAHTVMVKVSDLLPPHRKEQFELTCAGVEQDLARIEDFLRRGASLYVTPEGEYSRDGAMLRFRGIWDRIEPFARNVYITGISYDPFVGRRLSQLYRIVPMRKNADVVHELKTARPVTTSAMLSAWLLTQDGSFSEADAVAGVSRIFASLPQGVFVDPEFAAAPAYLVIEALRRMRNLGFVTGSRGALQCATERKHPQFTDVKDIVAFQARFLQETIEAAALLRPAPSAARESAFANAHAAAAAPSVP